MPYVQSSDSRSTPKYVSTDNDPLYRFHQWQDNLRMLEVTEIKTVPYVPLSHPFVERLIGTLRRECLDRTLFWTTTEFGRQIPEIPLQRLEGRQVLTKRSVHGHRETARKRNDSSRSNVLDLRPHLPPTKAGKALCEQDTRRRSGERLAPHRRSNPHVSFRAPEVTVIDSRPCATKNATV